MTLSDMTWFQLLVDILYVNITGVGCQKGGFHKGKRHTCNLYLLNQELIEFCINNSKVKSSTEVRLLYPFIQIMFIILSIEEHNSF